MPKPLLLFLLGCLLCACGTSRSVPVRADDGQFLDQSTTEPAQASRKLIYAAYLQLQVAEPDSTVGRIVELALPGGGQIVTTNSRQATIRVPAHRFQETLDEIATYGKVKSKQLDGEDVTDEYRDYAIRLDNAERSRQRYLELLALAKNVDEAITVERELERLNETIDLLKGRLNRLDQLEAYSTITVNVEKKPKLGPLGYLFKGVFAGVKWLFVRD